MHQRERAAQNLIGSRGEKRTRERPPEFMVLLEIASQREEMRDVLGKDFEKER